MQKKLRKRTINFLLVSLLFLSTFAYGQNEKNGLREVGIEFYGLDDFGLAFKKPLKNGKCLVLDGSLNLGYGFREINEDFGQSLMNFSSNFSVNLEKRIPIGERIYFVHGAGLGLSFGYNAIGNSDLLIDSQRQTRLNVALRPFYKLGFQYHFSEKLYLEASISPGIRLSYYRNRSQQQGEFERIEQETHMMDAQASFNPDLVKIGLFYRF